MHIDGLMASKSEFRYGSPWSFALVLLFNSIEGSNEKKMGR